LAEVEPNDSLATAQLLSGPASINGTMASATDTDYYSFTVGAGKSVVVSLAPNASSDYDLWAYNAAGVRVTSSTQGTGAVDSVTYTNSLATPVIAYARVVYFAGGTGATAGRYSLTVK
jgi:serine protease